MPPSSGNGSSTPQVNSRRAFDLVMQLMRIPGKSNEEGEVAEFVKQKLRAAGVSASALQHDTAHKRTPAPGQVGNLILKLPGRGANRGAGRRMLASHLDTVPICVGSDPHATEHLVTSRNPETGLGADNRAGVACTLAAALEILERDLPHPPLTFCWFVQEEIGLQGSRLVSKSLLGKPRLAFNWDGGSPTKLTIGATGGYRMEIDVRGRASHAGGAPEWGVSAIAIASLAIADLHRNGWHGSIVKGKQCGTSNVGILRGGEATNVVTDRVFVKAEARSHQPKFRERIVKEIEKAFRKAAAEVKNVAGHPGSVEFQGHLDYESFRLKRDEPCVVAAAEAVEALGYEPEYAIANGGVDANWTTRHGIPTVTLGCGQLNQHMVDEALDIEQFQTACQIALYLATAADERSAE